VETLTALETGRLLAAGELDAVDVCEAALERASGDAARHAFIALTPERAREEARASARRLRAGTPAGPLDGVPVAWKDLFDVRGMPTTAASITRIDAPAAAADAPVVARLAAAGMVCVGKTNLTELAFSGLGLNPHFGTPRNPVDVARIPGGSSSGSAVAVAASVVPCAIGSDTSGSVRVPAAFCGLVGFKPSSARIPRDGVFPLSPTLDSVGPLARSVADAVALDAAMRGRAPAVVGGAPLQGATLVVPSGELVDEAQPGVAARFEEAIAALERAGATVQRRSLPALEEVGRLIDEHGTIVAAEAAVVHAGLLAGPDAERIDRRVLRRLRGGQAMSADALFARRAALQTQVAAELDGAYLAMPTVRHTAPELEPLERDDELFAEVNMRTLRGAMLASYLDMPGVALPVGLADDGLPASLLLSAPSGNDDALLEMALAAEAALG
jgi:aspartyl-tRNA(Asn)/glutamyl-tRNA(Gln) amidotransferase subunit A